MTRILKISCRKKNSDRFEEYVYLFLNYDVLLYQMERYKIFENISMKKK